MRRILKITAYLLLFSIIALFVCDYLVKSHASDKCSADLHKLQKAKIGLLLGTSKMLANGNENQYYRHRITAAVDLFKSKKIEFILISGDNSYENYNEPQMMKDDLLKLGIPESKIILDYAGFREKDVIVISQQFHNERAIYLAKRYDINMQGYNAKDVDKYFGLKTSIREKFARVKLMLDLLFGKDTKYLGKKIVIK
jgi:SanA protein